MQASGARVVRKLSVDCLTCSPRSQEITCLAFEPRRLASSLAKALAHPAKEAETSGLADFDAEDKELSEHGVYDNAVMSRRQAALSNVDRRAASMFAIARMAGANLLGHEYTAYQKALAEPYPHVKGAPQMYPRSSLEGVQLELLRRSNISMPGQLNQRVYGTVYTLAKNKVWVDVGHSALAIVHRKELSVRAIVNSAVDVEGRANERDIREGDRFVFRIQSLRCPLGGIWVQPAEHDTSALHRDAWEEIKEAYAAQRNIFGRILNRVPGGFAVGVAGHIGRVDMLKSDPAKVNKLGALQEFVILRLQETQTGRLVFDLAHEGFQGKSHVGSAQGGPKRYTRHATSSFSFD